MSPYLQLVMKAVLAPREAVDMARQHANPLYLGFLYLGAVCVMAFVVLTVLPHLISPLHAYDPTIMGEAHVLDHPVNEGLLTALIQILMFYLSRWFWRKVTDPATPMALIDAGIAVTFAGSLALLVPQEVAFRLFENAGPAAFGMTVLVSLGLSLALTSVYFSHALGITLARSFGFNVTLLVVSILLAVPLMMTVFLLTGGSSDLAQTGVIP